MKKSLWLLLAITALIAVFAVAGCQPTSPEPSPTASPTPTVAPTTPPADYCPTTVETVVTSLYCDISNTEVSPNLSILITFDKDIVLLDDNEANWKVTVDRYVPYDGDDGPYEATLNAEVFDIEQVSSKLIRITATVVDGDFYGLICTESCYEKFVEDVLGEEPTEGYADTVTWAYIGGGFPYSDILGNLCPDCDISDEACCVACETCEEPEEHCPIGGCI